MENAHEIDPQVSDWLERNASTSSAQGSANEKPFFMWVNVWDPHTPYRTPEVFENPFKDDPLPEWYTEEVLEHHKTLAGPHSTNEIMGFDDEIQWWMEEEKNKTKYPTMFTHQPRRLDTMEDAKAMFDGYDMGIAYADMAVGRIVQKLKDLGNYEDTAIIISADHGENMGELGIYGDHQTADEFTHHIPMIIRWPGVTDAKAGTADDRLMYSLDMAATSLEWSGMEVPDLWDGQSFAGDYMDEKSTSTREHLVLSQMAWCAQRSARWDHYICIETYHDAFHDYPRHMVFDLKADPHEQHDLAPTRPDLLSKGISLLHEWKNEMMETATHRIDPLHTVMEEGGPLHIRGEKEKYMERLKKTGRSEIAERFETRAQPYKN